MNLHRLVVILLFGSFIAGFLLSRFTIKQVAPAPENEERFPENLTNFPVQEKDIPTIKIGFGSAQAHVGNPSFQLIALIPKSETWLPEKVQLINTRSDKAEREYLLSLSQYQKKCNMPDMIAY